MRRVVVTGMGMVTPLGCGVEHTWKRLLAGECGAPAITEFEVDDLACQIACVIPRGDGSDGTFNPDQWMEPKEQRKVDDFIVYAMAAAKQALEGCRLEAQDRRRAATRTGVMIGSGIGGIEGIADDRDHAARDAARAGSARSSSRAASSISPPAMSRSSTASRAPTTPWSPPARPARTPSATPRG